MKNKQWIELTNEYIKGIKNNSRRKIRTQDGRELFTIWIDREQCFYHIAGDEGFYMDEPDTRPTHILV